MFSRLFSFLLWSGATTSIFTVSVQSYTVLSNVMLAPKLEIDIVQFYVFRYCIILLSTGETEASPALPASLYVSVITSPSSNAVPNSELS